MSKMGQELERRLDAHKYELYEALKDIIEQADQTLLPLGVDLSDSIRVFGKPALALIEGKEEKQ